MTPTTMGATGDPNTGAKKNGDPTARSCEGCAQNERIGTRRRGDDKHLTGRGRHLGTTARIMHGIGA